MRRRTVTFLALLVVVGALAGPAAAQEQGEVVADGQGWATSTQVPGLGDPAAHTTLEPGDLPIGAEGTNETKRSYLLLDIPDAATSAQITLPVADGAGKNFGLAGPILACIVIEPFSLQSGDPIAESPEVECGDEPITGEVGEDGTHTWVLDPILARWRAGEPNNGVALVADISTPQPNYQITFHAEFFAPIGTYTVPAERSDSTESSPPPPPPASSDSDTTGSGSQDPAFQESPSFESGTTSFESGTASWSAPTFESLAPPPMVAEPPAEPGPEPVAAPPPSVTAVAAAGPMEPLPVNPLVWVLVPLALAVLWSAGRGLTGRGEPTSRLDRLLAQ
ncbi:MAG: hypothetical protein KY437_00510 [Actinobacteria bacterium]|nr:hypothetical protein [Actinomycetota bacterium]